MTVRGYLSALPAVLKDGVNEQIFRVYIADSIHAMMQGKRLEKRYSEIINPPKEETRTPEEVVSSIMSKLKGYK